MKFLTLLLLLSFTQLISSEEIDSILSDIKSKPDTSASVDLANSAKTTIFTRKDLDRMQAMYLTDVLKSNIMFDYSENRYGLTDPFSVGSIDVFASPEIKIYIDDHEIGGGLYSLSLAYYTKMNIDFVDHIEIYTGNTSYKYTSSGSLVIVKLYSKSIEKDEGSKISLHLNSNGGNIVSMYNAGTIGQEWSYFGFLSTEEDKKDKIKSHDTLLSRDSENIHAMGFLRSENKTFMIDALVIRSDSFASKSIDATPIDAELKSKKLHISYDHKIDNLTFATRYDFEKAIDTFKDKIMYSNVAISSSFLSFKVAYQKNTFKNNFDLSIKQLIKSFKYDTLNINGQSLDDEGKQYFQYETMLSLEDTYSISDELSSTISLRYLYLDNGNLKRYKDESNFGVRFGLTYIYDNWIMKTVVGKHTIPLNSGVYLNPTTDLSLVSSGNIKDFYAELTYKLTDSSYEFSLGSSIRDNFLVPNVMQNMRLESSEYDLTIDYMAFKWRYRYFQFNKILIEASHISAKHFSLSDSKYNKFVIRDLSTYGDFDIFNELIYQKNDVADIAYYDYGFGVSYDYSDDLTISLKAENILDKAKETYLFRINPATFSLEDPLVFTSYDKRVILSMKYTF